MKYKTLVLGAALACAPFASSHALELTEDLSVQLEATLASDYRTRGISQTQNDPAIQAAATLQHSSGLYLGVWSSNVDFGYGLKTRQELDYYAGWYWDQGYAPDQIDMTAMTHFVFGRVAPGGGSLGGVPGEIVPGAGSAHDPDASPYPGTTVEDAAVGDSTVFRNTIGGEGGEAGRGHLISDRQHAPSPRSSRGEGWGEG